MEDRNDFIDLVAQAVIDRIEERERIDRIVEMVAARVIANQKEAREAAEAEAVQPKLTEQDENSSPGAASAPDPEKE